MSPEDGEGAGHKLGARCRSTRALSEASGDDAGGVEGNSERPRVPCDEISSLWVVVNVIAGLAQCLAHSKYSVKHHCSYWCGEQGAIGGF